ncbi:hypothetical protein DM02DRAFT_662509 [Periconia macrospinosa]|uniref:Uncharacterized protein n=1 Tax=Periconia macrospinosa TaxID=97972 RepID=A0A2V1D6N1_9PLEO|nr:hypothetical protein DM02DRAFT_662509 [Periconia macrospinosa]
MEKPREENSWSSRKGKEPVGNPVDEQNFQSEPTISNTQPALDEKDIEKAKINHRILEEDLEDTYTMLEGEHFLGAVEEKYNSFKRSVNYGDFTGAKWNAIATLPEIAKFQNKHNWMLDHYFPNRWADLRKIHEHFKCPVGECRVPIEERRIHNLRELVDGYRKEVGKYIREHVTRS